jgi:hypothetical protein
LALTGKCALARAGYLESARATKSTAAALIAKVADCSAAQWQDFVPPLTSVRMKGFVCAFCRAKTCSIKEQIFECRPLE